LYLFGALGLRPRFLWYFFFGVDFGFDFELTVFLVVPFGLPLFFFTCDGNDLFYCFFFAIVKFDRRSANLKKKN
jgi:hypothetical protein